jgi:hypothetical protein
MQKFIPAALLLCFVLTGSAFAQVNSSIGGIVQDQSTALVPGVTITATNTLTGVVTSTLTNEAGAYNFAALPPGAYKVTATLPGFRTHTFNDVQLSAGTPIRLNFTLEVGTVTSNVEVSMATDTLLATSSSSIGEVLTETPTSGSWIFLS